MLSEMPVSVIWPVNVILRGHHIAINPESDIMNVLNQHANHIYAMTFRQLRDVDFSISF
jgi:hypothetical protein